MNKNNLTSCLVCLLITISGLASASLAPPNLTIDAQELDAVRTVAYTIEATHTSNGNPVWEGYDISTSPLIISFANGHVYAFNFHSSNPRWHALPISHSTVLYSSDDPEGISKIPMNPSYVLEGQSAFLYQLDLIDGPSYLPFLVLIHERFHQFQFQNFKPGIRSGGYQDHLNAQNLALVQLEELILTDFLKAEDAVTKMDRIKDFVAIRELRFRDLNPSSIHWEQDQQRMEGLAEYVSIKMYEAFPLIPDYDGPLHMQTMMEMYSKDENIADRAIKHRHYGVGASIAIALDFLKAQDWKAQTQQGAPLDTLLMQNVKLNPKDLISRVEKIKNEYGFTTIYAAINAKINSYQKEIDDIINDFQEQPAVEVALFKPRGMGMSGGGTNLQMFHLADGGTLSVDNSSVNTTPDNTWKFSLTNMPVVIQKRTGEIDFKVEKNLQIVINNKSFNLEQLLKSNREFVFNKISWKGGCCEFYSEEYPGTLSVRDNKIYIMFHVT